MYATLQAATQSTMLESAVSDDAWTIDELVAGLRAAGASQGPFDAEIVAFCGELSKALMAMRRHPDAVALGFWLRPASLERTRAEMEERLPRQTISAPRGLAFHVAPANVDTLFAYSWLLSLLAGNSNVVRISSRGGDVQRRVLDAVAEQMSRGAYEAIGLRNRLVTSDHSDEVAMGLSAACDVRVVWGGDATIERFRSFPIAPHARDVVFADRHSLALLDADAVAGLDGPDIGRLAERFFADAFSYDQGACSSPRLVVWRGSARGVGATEAAQSRFHDAVQTTIEKRGYIAETGAAINKKVMAFERAAGRDGVVIEERSNEITWVSLPDGIGYDRANCGGGLFFELVSGDLEHDLGTMVDKRDQTASCFGFTEAEMRSLARSLNGRGIDRFVAMGQALQFDIVWDGLDLLGEFSTRVVVDVS